MRITPNESQNGNQSSASPGTAPEDSLRETFIQRKLVEGDGRERLAAFLMALGDIEEEERREV